MTDKQARKEHVGGEVLAYIWGKEVQLNVSELVENPLRFPPVLM